MNHGAAVSGPVFSYAMVAAVPDTLSFLAYYSERSHRFIYTNRIRINI